MMIEYKNLDDSVRTSRRDAGRNQREFPRRPFDKIAYAAALEVLG
jgi:hypothetical protein